MGSKTRTGHKKKRKGKEKGSPVLQIMKGGRQKLKHHICASHLVPRVSNKLMLQGERWSFVTIIQVKIYVLQIQI